MNEEFFDGGFFKAFTTGTGPILLVKDERGDEVQVDVRCDLGSFIATLSPGWPNDDEGWRKRDEFFDKISTGGAAEALLAPLFPAMQEAEE